MYHYKDYNDLFTQYGSPSDHADVKAWIYLTRPDKITTPSEVAREDKSTALTIAALESLIGILGEHRQKLSARYGELETMPYKRRLTIKRRKTYNNGVRFSVQILRILEDGTEVRELLENYTGKERHTALKRFAELQKLYPGIEAVKDIEKSKWER